LVIQDQPGALAARRQFHSYLAAPRARLHQRPVRTSSEPSCGWAARASTRRPGCARSGSTRPGWGRPA